MSDQDLRKQLDTALARIAALESQRAPQPAFDAQKFAQSMMMNPAGVLQQLGVPVDHVAKTLVAQHMGNDAPEALRSYALMGPTVSAVHQTQSELQTLRQKLEVFEAEARSRAVQQSFSALAGDKTKYPLLAAAIAKNPELFNAEVSTHQGDVAALADRFEAQLKVLAPVVAPQPASSGNADSNAQSQQSKALPQYGGTGGIDPTPPPIPAPKPGVFTQEDHVALRDRIVAKHTATRPE